MLKRGGAKRRAAAQRSGDRVRGPHVLSCSLARLLRESLT
jgi:hypothetical protein